MKNIRILSLLSITAGTILITGCNPVIYNYPAVPEPYRVVVANPKPSQPAKPTQEQIDAAKKTAQDKKAALQEKKNTNKPLPPADDTTTSDSSSSSHPVAQKLKDRHNGDTTDQS